MLQIHTTRRLDQIEIGLRKAAARHGGSVLASSHVGQVLRGEGAKANDAITFAVCFSDLYAPLLRSDIRFSVFLPSRIAVCTKGEGALLEAISPIDYCRLLHRPELESLAASVEETLRLVMEEAANQVPHASDHLATEDLVNMRLALPQRIDCHGTKVQEMAGTDADEGLGG